MKNPSFLSRQVIRGQYYFLDLSARASSRETVVLCGGIEACAPGYHVVRPNGFFCHGIEFVVGGKGVYKTGGVEHALQAGSLYYYAPNTPHAIRTDVAAPLVKYFVDFVGEPAISMIKRGPLARRVPVVIDETHQIWRTFEAMQASGTPKTQESSAICARLLEVLLLLTVELGLRNPGEKSTSWEIYTRHRTFIQEHCRSLQNLEDIARHCHTDASSLCRLFRKHGDRSPYQFLVLLKMRRAAELMASGGMMVKEVAHDVGYDDAYLFSKIFKRIHGMSPQHFLKHATAPAPSRSEPSGD